MAILGFLMTPVSATAGFGILVLWVGLGLALKGNALLRWGGAFVLAMIAGGVGLALGGNAPAPTSMTTSSRASATATPATSVSNIDKSTSPKRTAARDSREHATTVAMWGVKIAPITDALGREVRAVSVAASNMNVSAMVESCRTMKRSVRSLSNELPAPDSEIDAALSAVVSEFTQAADSCIRGGTSLNASEIEQASKHMLAGGGHLSRASARVTELSRYIR
jgi:hypothetical protein